MANQLSVLRANVERDVRVSEAPGRGDYMAQPSDVHISQALYDVFVGKDVLADEAVVDEASLLHLPGRSGLAGQYQGGEAILGVLRRMAEITDGTLRFSPSRVLTADDHAIVVLGRASAARQGKRLDAEEVHVLSIRDGKVREIWVFHQNQDHVDEFWTG